MIPRRSVAGLSLLVLLSACHRSSDPVRESLDAVLAGARARDANAVVDRVSTSFRADDGSDRAAVHATLRRYFAAYEILNVSVRDLVLERAEKAALARFTAELSGQPRKFGGLEGLLPSASTYRFEIRFEPEEDRWKIAWARWTPINER